MAIRMPVSRRGVRSSRRRHDLRAQVPGQHGRDQERPMKGAPHDEGPGCAVPQAADEEREEQAGQELVVPLSGIFDRVSGVYT